MILLIVLNLTNEMLPNIYKDNNISHLNIPKKQKELNCVIENSNKHIDYELLPLIYNARDEETIKNKTIEYNQLHNYYIPRTIRRNVKSQTITEIMTPVERYQKHTRKAYTINGEYAMQYLKKDMN
ncbi:MAG: hypothetical protein LBF36_03455 [Mycoplasmataceae bacterium]|jgi:hypothetical protein|nr:hypothetical protein [Mycoplasmataceae bacterium]